MSSTLIPDVLPVKSLNREVYLDLLVYQRFLDNRKIIIRGLYAREVVYSQLRDDLVRHILIEFGGNNARNISFYQKKLVYLGSYAAIRREIIYLERCELIRLGTTQSDRRAAVVSPTLRLVQWYSTQMPRLYEEVRRFLTMREAGVFDEIDADVDSVPE